MAPFILLVQPWIYDFAAYDLWIKPLGLLSIASVLKQAGCGVHLIDCLDPDHPDMRSLPGSRQPSRKENGQGHFHRQELPKPSCLAGIARKYCRYGIHPEIFVKELCSLPRPDAVLVSSMMTYWYPAVTDCIRLIKKVFPDVPVLVGGVYATLCSDHARTHTGADAILQGTFNLTMLKKFEQAIGKRLVRPSLNFFADPDCTLLRNQKTIPIQTSRGCPYSCPYCASSLLHSGFIQKSPSDVVSSIVRWYEQGATDFVLYDDALLVNAEQHFIPLFQKISACGVRARFHAPNGLHVRGIDDRIAELMKQAGFSTLRLSLETVHPLVQQYIGSKASEQDFIRAVSSLMRAGFAADTIGAYILAGLPFQKPQSVEHTIQFIRSCGLRPMIAEYSPIPGTQLWQDAVRCSPFPIVDEPLFHNNTILPCQWEEFTPDDLNRLKQLARKPIEDQSYFSQARVS